MQCVIFWREFPASGKHCLVVSNRGDRIREKINFRVLHANWKYIFFLNLSAISEHFDGEIGGFSQKWGKPKIFFGKKVGLIGFYWIPVRWMIAEEGKSISGRHSEIRYGKSWNFYFVFSWPTSGGASFRFTFVRLSVCFFCVSVVSWLNLFNICGSRWDIFFEMFLVTFCDVCTQVQIIIKFLFVCQFVGWLTVLLIIQILGYL